MMLGLCNYVGEQSWNCKLHAWLRSRAKQLAKAYNRTIWLRANMQCIGNHRSSLVNVTS